MRKFYISYGKKPCCRHFIIKPDKYLRRNSGQQLRQIFGGEKIHQRQNIKEAYLIFSCTMQICFELLIKQSGIFIVFLYDPAVNIAFTLIFYALNKLFNHIAFVGFGDFYPGC